MSKPKPKQLSLEGAFKRANEKAAEKKEADLKAQNSTKMMTVWYSPTSKDLLSDEKGGPFDFRCNHLGPLIDDSVVLDETKASFFRNILRHANFQLRLQPPLHAWMENSPFQILVLKEKDLFLTLQPDLIQPLKEKEKKSKKMAIMVPPGEESSVDEKKSSGSQARAMSADDEIELLKAGVEAEEIAEQGGLWGKVEEPESGEKRGRKSQPSSDVDSLTNPRPPSQKRKPTLSSAGGASGNRSNDQDDSRQIEILRGSSPIPVLDDDGDKDADITMVDGDADADADITMVDGAEPIVKVPLSVPQDITGPIPMETVDEATATVDAAAKATTNTTTNAIDAASATDVAGETAPAEESKMEMVERRMADLSTIAMIKFGIDVYNSKLVRCLRIMMADPNMVFSRDINHDDFSMDPAAFGNLYLKHLRDLEIFKKNVGKGGGFTLISEVKSEAGKNDKNPSSRVINASTERCEIGGIEIPIGAYSEEIEFLNETIVDYKLTDDAIKTLAGSKPYVRPVQGKLPKGHKIQLRSKDLHSRIFRFIIRKLVNDRVSELKLSDLKDAMKADEEFKDIDLRDWFRNEWKPYSKIILVTIEYGRTKPTDKSKISIASQFQASRVNTSQSTTILGGKVVKMIENRNARRTVINSLRENPIRAFDWISGQNPSVPNFLCFPGVYRLDQITPGNNPYLHNWEIGMAHDFGWDLPDRPKPEFPHYGIADVSQAFVLSILDPIRAKKKKERTEAERKWLELSRSVQEWQPLIGSGTERIAELKSFIENNNKSVMKAADAGRRKFELELKERQQSQETASQQQQSQQQ